MIEYDIRRKELAEDAKDYAEANGIRSKDYVKRYVNKKMNHFMPMVDVINSRMNRFNPAHFEITEVFDNLTDKFDLFVITGCLHFVGVKNAGVSGESNDYCEVMRAVQSQSAIIFFILIHIPLSRYNSGYCFFTALLPMMLNLKTKYWFYEQANNLVVLFFKSDKEAKNHV